MKDSLILGSSQEILLALLRTDNRVSILYKKYFLASRVLGWGGSVHFSDIVATGYSLKDTESAGLGGNAEIMSQLLDLRFQLWPGEAGLYCYWEHFLPLQSFNL